MASFKMPFSVMLITEEVFILKDKSKEHIIFRSDISDIDKGGAVTTSSSQECTGLIPSDPKSREERSSYEDIVNYSGDNPEKHTKHL